MSVLFETLGRGLLAHLTAAFENQLPALEGDNLQTLRQRFEASPTSFDLAMRCGSIALREMRLRDAQTSFEAAQTLQPDAVTPWLGLACVADEQGDLTRALDHLHDAQQRDGSDPALAFGVAFCHERLGQSEDAKREYRRVIKLNKRLRNAYERLAAIAVREGDLPTALAQYEQLVEMEPGDLDCLIQLGGLYLACERPAEAIHQFQSALLIEPDNGEERAELAGVGSGEGALHDAISSLEHLVQKYPGVAPFHVQLADLYVKAGDDARALDQYHTALTAQPNFLEATVKLGTQHMRQGRYTDAALTFNRAVELNDRLIAAFAGLGLAQYHCGRKAESLATFDLAASLEPSTTRLFSQALRLHLQSEQQQSGQRFDDGDGGVAEGEAPRQDTLLKEAIRRHRQAIANTPNQADLHYRYGLLLRQMGRHDEAMRAFRNAVSINPCYAKALVKLAIALKELDQVDEAIETFQRAMQVDTRYVDVHYQLGLLFAQKNQFDLALEEFEQVLEHAPQDPAFRQNLALALQQIGMVDRAAATWRSICDMSPVTDQLLAERERVLREAGPN